MRAPIRHVPPRRAVARPLLACALAMALSTLAGGRVDVDVQRAGARAPAQGSSAAPAPAPFEPTVRADPPSALVMTDGPLRRSEPPPFAPGGDDVKNWDDPVQRGVHAAAGTAGFRVPAAQPRTQPVPWPVLATSWHNRQLAAALPLPDSAGGWPTTTAGDFFQEGRLALFAAVSAADGSMSATFLARNDTHRWVDRSAELFADDADRRLCASPRQALTADLNRDGKPDVYLVCSDAPHIAFVSRPGGGYRKLDTAFSAWATHAEAADLNGDGDIDVFTIDGARVPVLWGRGDGSFDYLPR